MVLVQIYSIGKSRSCEQKRKPANCCGNRIRTEFLQNHANKNRIEYCKQCDHKIRSHLRNTKDFAHQISWNHNKRYSRSKKGYKISMNGTKIRCCKTCDWNIKGK